MIKKILFVMLLMTFESCSDAQIVLNSQFEKDVFNTRVKLVDEFMLRFNGEKITAEIDTTRENYRLLNLISLFDAQMFGSKNGKDSLFKEAQNFATDVLKSNVKIDYADTNWVAVAPCRGKLKGKAVDFIVCLTVECRGKNMYKWVIDKVIGDVFSIEPNNKSVNAMISPDDHETNFMTLNHITTSDKDYITAYKQKDYKLDQTMVFFTLVKNGLLTIDYVKGLQFEFFQIPGWRFSITEFDRTTMNSGWLITSFSKMESKEKEDYLRSLYNK